MTKALIEARGPVQQAFAPFTKQVEQITGLGAPTLVHVRERIRDLMALMPAAAIEALVEAGYTILPPGGTLEGLACVQAQVTGTFEQHPFQKVITVNTRLADGYTMRFRHAFMPQPVAPFEYVVGMFAGLCGDLVRSELAPLIARELAELETNAIGPAE